MLQSDPLALDNDLEARASARALARQKQLLGLLKHSSSLINPRRQVVSFPKYLVCTQLADCIDQREISRPNKPANLP